MTLLWLIWLLLPLQELGKPSSKASSEVPSGKVLQGLTILQEANGIPGRPSQKATPQLLRVTPKRLLLVDRETGITYLFRLDTAKPSIYEISADGTQYRDVERVNTLQRDRDRWEQQLFQQMRSMPREERERVLRDNHLRADQKRMVTVEERPHEEKVINKSVKRYVIKENDRQIVDVLVTEDLGVEIPFFEFYSRVGAFSKQVLAKLKTIPGVPLSADITVVTATLNYTIKARATAAYSAEIPEEELQLPSHAEEYKETPWANCPICGVKVEKANPPGNRHFRNGGYFYFDRSECRREFIKSRVKKKPK